MGEPKDGGPAFPIPAFETPIIGSSGTAWHPGSPGMALRDWFAGQVLAASGDAYTPNNASRLAKDAYAISDAMLAARALPSKGDV